MALTLQFKSSGQTHTVTVEKPFRDEKWYVAKWSCTCGDAGVGTSVIARSTPAQAVHAAKKNAEKACTGGSGVDQIASTFSRILA